MTHPLFYALFSFVNLRGLTDALDARLSEWSRADIWHRAKDLRARGRIPRGKPGPGGGADMEPRHAAEIVVALLSGEPAIYAATVAEHFTDKATRDQALEIDVTRAPDRSALEVVGRCRRQAVAELAMQRVFGGRIDEAERLRRRTVAVAGTASAIPEGRAVLAPAGGFVGAVEALIAGATRPEVPWWAVRAVGVTRFGTGDGSPVLVGWLELRPEEVLPLACVIGGGGGITGDLFEDVLGVRFPFDTLQEQALAGRVQIYATTRDRLAFMGGVRDCVTRRIAVATLIELGQALAGASVEEEIGTALTDESGATNANGSEESEPLEVHRTAVGAADTSIAIESDDTPAPEPVARTMTTLRRTSSPTGGKPDKDRGSHARQRGGGGAQRRNAAQTQ